MRRLNYIGSKHTLVDWIGETLREVAGLESFVGLRIADLFAGTGSVSYYFRKQGACVLSNDVERYSSVITRAMTRSVYTDRCKELLETLNATPGTTVGYVTTHYSPYGDSERMFFTVENASRMDFLRARLEALRPEVTEDEFAFLLASFLVSADSVSNVPAVYGCYLKHFKAKAEAPFQLLPIHTDTTPPDDDSATTAQDVLTLELPDVDIAYLDPPYNERQYSKNYFPLNVLAKSPEELLREPPLKGKTGIPQDCFLSPFCQSRAVEGAFRTLIASLPATWVLVSYSSEGLLPLDTLRACLAEHGEVTVVERPYKRFKSFAYNATAPVTEYLLCLHKTRT